MMTAIETAPNDESPRPGDVDFLVEELQAYPCHL